jgi:hypothetical protein
MYCDDNDDNDRPQSTRYERSRHPPSPSRRNSVLKLGNNITKCFIITPTTKFINPDFPTLHEHSLPSHDIGFPFTASPSLETATNPHRNRLNFYFLMVVPMLVSLLRRRPRRPRRHFPCPLDRAAHFAILLRLMRSFDGAFSELRRIAHPFQMTTRFSWLPRPMRRVLPPLLGERELHRPCPIRQGTTRRWDC